MEEDMMSNLPDDVLIQILSNLSIEKAIRTSILSTRWISLWTCLPTLHLTYVKKTNNAVVIRKFIDSVLVDHRMPFLHNLSIHTDYNDLFVIKSWILGAIDRNLSGLGLLVHLNVPLPASILVLPQSLFSGSTLVELILVYVYALFDFPVASPDCFPKLKVLNLNWIRFKIDNDSASNFVSSCPILEHLDLFTENVDCGFNKMTVSAPFLKTFELKYWNYLPRLNVDDTPKVVINAPALEHIVIDDYGPQVYEMKDISSLVKADISFSDLECTMPLDSDEYFGSCAMKVLHYISNVKSLQITDSTIKNKTLSEIVTGIRSLPTLCNLTTLELKGKRSTKWNWKLLISFLASCPILEVLIMDELHHESLYRDRCSDVPTCLISHLKTIEISNYHASYEVGDIGYFLKNAKVLEKLIVKGFVTKSGEIITKGFVEASAEILILPRSSPTCQIEIRQVEAPW